MSHLGKKLKLHQGHVTCSKSLSWDAGKIILSFLTPYKLNTPEITVLYFTAPVAMGRRKREAQNGLVDDYLKGMMFLIKDRKCRLCGFINTEFSLN